MNMPMQMENFDEGRTRFAKVRRREPKSDFVEKTDD